MIKSVISGGALAFALVPLAAAAAQPVVSAAPTAVTAASPPTIAATTMTLPSNSEILLTANREVNSKSIKQGDTFELSVARDVMLGDQIVIPRGTKANGRISWRTGKGAFGKSAKMEFDIVDLDLGGRSIPVSGHYRVEGQGNTGAAVGAAVAVGVFGAFVTGRSAVIGQGSEWKAFTRGPVAVTLAAAPAPAGTGTPAGN